MGIRNVDMACARCRGITPHTVKTPNHILHLLLAIVSAGLWVIPWLLVSFTSDKRCERCKLNLPPLTDAKQN